MTMKRRDFITLLGGAATCENARPRRTADATRPRRRGDRMRGQRAMVTLASLMLALGVGSAEARPRIAFLSLGAPQEGATLVTAFADGLRRLGYAEGRNVDLDYRYAAGDVEQLKLLALELIALKPDVLIGSEPSAARALKSVAPMLPIVCLALTDALIPDL